MNIVLALLTARLPIWSMLNVEHLLYATQKNTTAAPAPHAGNSRAPESKTPCPLPPDDETHISELWML